MPPPEAFSTLVPTPAERQATGGSDPIRDERRL